MIACILRSSLIFLAIGAQAVAGQAPEARRLDGFRGMEVIRLVDGPNRVDLNADGKLDLVVLAWRENYNAHGYDMITFYISDPATEPTDRAWSLVPLFDSTGTQKDDRLRTSRGADCILTDFRLVRTDSGTPLTLIIGARDFGTSYADSMPVQFTVYRLLRNDKGLVGWPAFRFQAQRTQTGQRPYCDINVGFAAELGLGPYREHH